MADAVMTTRLIVKEIATQAGVHATFMPKPIAGMQGSGMHTHFSLFNEDTNAFYDENDPVHLSSVGQGFIAGLLTHAREITAITNQWVNSYKRLVVGYEAPVYVSWARNNRSALIRVPHAKEGRPDPTRIEYRSPDPACNPYLMFAVVLAAGLRGIEKEYELPPEAETQPVRHERRRARAAAGIDALPGSLAEALDEMEGSSLVRRDAGRARLRVVPPQQARRSGPTTRRRSTPFELERYFSGAVDGTSPRLSRPGAAGVGAGAGARAATRGRPSRRRKPRCSDEPDDGWAGAVIVAANDAEGAFALCRALRKRDQPLEPLLVLVGAALPRRTRTARGPLRRLLPVAVPAA